MSVFPPSCECDCPEKCRVGDWVIVRSGGRPLLKGARPGEAGQLIMPDGAVFEAREKEPEDGKHNSRWVRVR